MAHGPTDTRSIKRLAIIAPDGESLLRQRAELIAEVLAHRHSVLALVPEASAATLPSLSQRGLAAATYPMPRNVPHMLADGKAVTALTAALVEWRPHVVLCFGAKPMLLGAMAAKKAGVVRRVGLMTTLADGMNSEAAAIPAWGWRRLLRGGLEALDGIVFHNAAHRARLHALGLLRPELAIAVVPGAGVDLMHHALQPLPALTEAGTAALNFLMIARKDAAKGISEFCQAAKAVRERAPDTRFILAGPDGDLAAAKIAAFGDIVQVLGDQDDIRPLLAAAHVVVVPSWGEGLPRILLEALATGRPVITSDIAGCREAVDERVNGILVPPRDAAALADAMLSFLKRPDLIPAMARASRSKAERRFDVRGVNGVLMGVLGL
jgi:glycosyltransferase involved in cell wall biosynthesis